MDWVTILNQIFSVCVVPLLGILTSVLVSYLTAKKNSIIANSNDEMVKKYTNMLTQTISDCVIATNQTYVEALKNQNAFDAEAQKIAFEKTYQAVTDVLSADAVEYLTNAYGDLQGYITQKIEAEVNKNK